MTSTIYSFEQQRQKALRILSSLTAFVDEGGISGSNSTPSWWKTKGVGGKYY